MVEFWTCRNNDPEDDELIREFVKVYNFVALEASKCFQLILDGQYETDETIVMVDITSIIERSKDRQLPKKAYNHSTQIGYFVSPPGNRNKTGYKIVGAQRELKEGKSYWGVRYQGSEGITLEHREYMKAIARSLKWDGEEQYKSKIGPKLIENEVRVSNAASPVWNRIAKPPKKSQVKIDRIIRNTSISSEVKKRYVDKCFICKKIIQVKKGNYSEAAHIRPLGKGGFDSPDNVIVLCPNHHVEFDYGMVTMMMVDKQTLKIVHKNEENEFNEKSVKLHPTHELNSEYLEYHYKKIFNKR